MADLTLEPGNVVAGVRAGCVDSTVCDCGSIETIFTSVESAPVSESCGVGRPEDTPSACYACRSSDRIAARSLQGCSACSKGYGMMKKGWPVFLLSHVWSGNLLIEDPEVIGFLGNISKVNHWWEVKGGHGNLGC